MLLERLVEDRVEVAAKRLPRKRIAGHTLAGGTSAPRSLLERRRAATLQPVGSGTGEELVGNHAE